MFVAGVAIGDRELAGDFFWRIDVSMVCGPEGIKIVEGIQEVFSGIDGLDLRTTKNSLVFKVVGDCAGHDMESLAKRINNLNAKMWNGYCYKEETSEMYYVSLRHSDGRTASEKHRPFTHDQ